MTKKARKAKVVFTNGCFDIIHPGHIEVLEFAKSLGGKLVVGINSDRAVKLLKGQGKSVADIKTYHISGKFPAFMRSNILIDLPKFV